jgi:hypothetical protein
MLLPAMNNTARVSKILFHNLSFKNWISLKLRYFKLCQSGIVRTCNVQCTWIWSSVSVTKL